MEKLLSLLPQRDVIVQADAERWLDGILRWQSERAEWHVKRLMGIGGSEMGAVLRGLHNLPNSGFSSFDKVIQQKLMKRLPTKQNDHMERGTVLEELAQLAFLYRYGAARDLKALEAIKDCSSRPGYEWLIGNLDDINILNGKRFLNDFKVPSSFSNDVDYDYQVQLHHYGLQGRMAGVKFDGYLLTKLDLAPEIARSLVDRFPTMSNAEKHALARTIAKMDIPGMRVVSMGVEHKRSLDLDILEAGSVAWNDYVLKGIVPTMTKPITAELDEIEKLDLANLQQQYSQAKAGISHLEEVASVASVKIQNLVAGVDLVKESLPINIVKVGLKNHDKAKLIQEAISRGAKPEELVADDAGYDVVALVAEIKRLNGDPESSHLKDSKPDADKAKTYLEAIDGLSLDDFRQPGVTISLSRKKPDVLNQGVLKSELGELIAPWFEKHAFGNDQEDECVDPDSLESWVNDVAAGMHLETLSEGADDESEDHTKRPKHSAVMR